MARVVEARQYARGVRYRVQLDSTNPTSMRDYEWSQDAVDEMGLERIEQELRLLVQAESERLQQRTSCMSGELAGTPLPIEGKELTSDEFKLVR